MGERQYLSWQKPGFYLDLRGRAIALKKPGFRSRYKGEIVCGKFGKERSVFMPLRHGERSVLSPGTPGVENPCLIAKVG
ncbi:hypothetical protein QUB44_26545 [Microcoleus sp. AT3-D2]